MLYIPVAKLVGIDVPNSSTRSISEVVSTGPNDAHFQLVGKATSITAICAWERTWCPMS